MSPRPRSRRLAVSLVAAAVLAACTPSPPSPGAVDATAVNDAMAALADARRVAAEQVDAELRAAVRVEPLVMGLRSPSSIDATLEEVPAVAAMFERSDPAGGGPVLDRLEVALRTARGAIDATLDEVEPGSWQQDYLTAQLEVVAALDTWAQASRDVHQVLVDNWELWQGLVADAVALDENRWRYRTEEEAAGTWEIEVRDDLEALRSASAAVGPVADARDEAATTVAAADQRAAQVFAQRPSDQPSGQAPTAP